MPTRSLGALAALALLLTVACVRKTPVADVREPDLLEKICIKEQKRFEESPTGKMYVYRNNFMDEYYRDPWEPKVLFERIQESRGICREALLYLMVQTHPYWVRKRWPMFEKKLSEDDHGLMVMYFQVQRTRNTDELILRVLNRSKSPKVREKAAVAVTSIDQNRFADDLAGILRREKDPGVLGELVMSLSLKKAPELIESVLPLFEIDDEDLHLKTVLTLAQSDFEGKQALFERDLNHPSKKIRETARGVIESLRDKGSLEMTMSAALLDQQKVDEKVENLNETFIAAIKKGNIGKAVNYLHRGADPNARDEQGRTALLLAVHYGDAPFMADLISRGADVNGADYEGNSVLMTAVLAKRPDRIELLLEYGADPHKTNYLGTSPLSLARSLKQKEIVALLSGEPQAAAQQ
ncbi:MAG: ankyrin repeat domain-containing protein [Acidobacteriota bacterium]|nr:ankyrin repeat domain-containing protein [Acidobacteriota bacterium]